MGLVPQLVPPERAGAVASVTAARTGTMNETVNLVLKRARAARPSYGWQVPERPKATWWKRAAMWFGVVCATALISTLVASAITPGLPYRAARAVADRFRPEPPLAQTVVAGYVQQTREAPFWDRRPLIFPSSVSYFRTHFAALDPRREHPYRKTKFHLWVPQLVHEAPVFAGFPVEVAGVIRELNILSPAMPNRRIEWIVQLGGITVRRSGIVYCRVTEPVRQKLRGGDIVTVSGIVLGTGPIRLVNGQLDQAVYMVCGAMRQPTGSFGRLARYLEQHPRIWSSLYESPARAHALLGGSKA